MIRPTRGIASCSRPMVRASRHTARAIVPRSIWWRAAPSHARDRGRADLTGWPIGFASAPYDPEWAMRYPPDHISFGVLAASEAGAAWNAVGAFVSVMFSLNAWRLIDTLFEPVFAAAASLIYPGVTYG
jgi:hypothetical protein